jgi:hypothetical protein
MALKQVNVIQVSEPILNANNAFYTQSFNADFILRAFRSHLSYFHDTQFDKNDFFSLA